MRFDVSNNGAWANNSSGFTVEISGSAYLKTSVPTFADLKKLLSEEKWSGTIKIYRSWDRQELFSGTVDQARSKFGVKPISRPSLSVMAARLLFGRGKYSQGENRSNRARDDTGSQHEIQHMVGRLDFPVGR
jgi:hypothetical protein